MMGWMEGFEKHKKKVSAKSNINSENPICAAFTFVVHLWINSRLADLGQPRVTEYKKRYSKNLPLFLSLVHLQEQMVKAIIIV